MNSVKKKKKPFNRYKVITIVMSVIFIVIILRLIYLQVFRYEDYKDKANTRARRFISEQAPRGEILDCNDKVLATNKETYTLTFTETDESKKQFYTTIDKLYKMLEEHGENFQDKFQLKLNNKNELYFNFNMGSSEDKSLLEVRFKKDRGLDEVIKRKLFKNKEEELTTEETEKLEEELLKITPYETFEYLVSLYNMYELLNPIDKEEIKKYIDMSPKEITTLLLEKYSLQELRKYMVVKDALKIHSFSTSKAITIASDIKEESVSLFYQKLNDLPGINIVQSPIRYYPNGELASSVLGYVSSINSDSKEKYEARGYDISTDLIGISGIESSFESVLKGSKGGKTVTVNSAGRTINELFALETSPGNNVHLTIDKDIQYSTEKMLKHVLTFLQNGGDETSTSKTKKATRGAAVAIEVDTGKVLALVSEPGFDPNDFTHGQLCAEKSKEYFNPDLDDFGNKFIEKWGLKISLDELFPKNKYGQREDIYDIYPKPFYNYATMGLIPPGSTFKPMTSLVGLKEGVIDELTTITANGINYDKHPEIFGKNTPPEDKNAVGVINLFTALKNSSNSYFFDTAVQLYYKYKDINPVEGLNIISRYAWKLGLGIDPKSNQKTGTGIEIAENFGNTYNFESFKKKNVYYAKFKLVDALENGLFPKRGTKFPPIVGISENPSDDKNLAKSKSDLKKLAIDKINEIQTKTNIVKDFNKFATEVKDALQTLYNVAPNYQKSIDNYIANKDSSMTVDKALDRTAEAIATWVIYDMSSEITSPVELANAAIGQGMSQYSPVQIANYIATLVNGGSRYKVHLVDKITNSEGDTIEEFKPEIIDKINIDSKNLDLIKEGMYRVNHDSSGKAGSGYVVFKNFPIKTGGKTGTATWRKDQKDYGREAFGTYVAFAPLDNPKIAVAVAIYDGYHGYYGAPVARAIFETYFREDIKQKYPGYRPRYSKGFSGEGEVYDFTLNPTTENKNQIEVNKTTKKLKSN